MVFREGDGHDHVIDVHYSDLMQQPMEALRKLYAALSDEFTAETEASIQHWLDDNPQGKFGRHEYKLAQFGLTESEVRQKFTRYLASYVEAEG